MAVSVNVAIAPAADVCGVCGGMGAACSGCDGVPFSGLSSKKPLLATDTAPNLLMPHSS